MASITFNVRADTRFGETLKIVGSHGCLGAWNAENALPLHTEPSKYPRWTVGHFFKNTRKYTPLLIEYKYIKVGIGGNIIWEEGTVNRTLTIEGNDCGQSSQSRIVDDGHFGFIQLAEAERAAKKAMAQGETPAKATDLDSTLDLLRDLAEEISAAAAKAKAEQEVAGTARAAEKVVATPEKKQEKAEEKVVATPQKKQVVAKAEQEAAEAQAEKKVVDGATEEAAARAKAEEEAKTADESAVAAQEAYAELMNAQAKSDAMLDLAEEIAASAAKAEAEQEVAGNARVEEEDGTEASVEEETKTAEAAAKAMAQEAYAELASTRARLVAHENNANQTIDAQAVFPQFDKTYYELNFSLAGAAGALGRFDEALRPAETPKATKPESPEPDEEVEVKDKLQSHLHQGLVSGSLNAALHEYTVSSKAQSHLHEGLVSRSLSTSSLNKAKDPESTGADNESQVIESRSRSIPDFNEAQRHPHATVVPQPLMAALMVMLKASKQVDKTLVSGPLASSLDQVAKPQSMEVGKEGDIVAKVRSHLTEAKPVTAEARKEAQSPAKVQSDLHRNPASESPGACLDEYKVMCKAQSHLHQGLVSGSLINALDSEAMSEPGATEADTEAKVRDKAQRHLYGGLVSRSLTSALHKAAKAETTEAFKEAEVMAKAQSHLKVVKPEATEAENEAKVIAKAQSHLHKHLAALYKVAETESTTAPKDAEVIDKAQSHLKVVKPETTEAENEVDAIAKALSVVANLHRNLVSGSLPVALNEHMAQSPRAMVPVPVMCKAQSPHHERLVSESLISTEADEETEEILCLLADVDKKATSGSTKADKEAEVRAKMQSHLHGGLACGSLAAAIDVRMAPDNVQSHLDESLYHWYTRFSSDSGSFSESMDALIRYHKHLDVDAIENVSDEKASSESPICSQAPSCEAAPLAAEPAPATPSWARRLIEKAAYLCSHHTPTSGARKVMNGDDSCNGPSQLAVISVDFAETVKTFDFQIEWPLDKSAPIVTSIIHNGAADRHGIRTGDRILQLNSTKTKGQSHKQLLPIFHHRPLTLLLERKAIDDKVDNVQRQAQGPPESSYKFPWEQHVPLEFASQEQIGEQKKVTT